jgi:hypothetical protein
MHRKGCLARLGLLALALGCAGVQGGAQATLVADAHVNSALPTMNSGGISNVNVGGGYTGLLQFDLSVLPVGTTAVQVSRAVLVVYVNRVDTPGVVSLQPALGAWTEGTVTEATMPALTAAVQTANVSQAGAYVAMDVTGLVQLWVGSPATNFGVGLTASSAVLAIDSKENDLTGHGATLEVELASAGPTGPVGPQGPIGPQGLAGAVGAAGATGAQGVPGEAGPAGSTGPMGLTGAVGATGASGPAGATGAPGPAGATGAQGPAGPAGQGGTGGFVYRGSYEYWINYALGDVVFWQGASWTSLQPGNSGNAPDQNPLYWGVLSAPGPQGPLGATGAAGPSGPAGSMGPQGSQGPQGPMGIDGSGGPPGLTGATGPVGPSGALGPQGIAGPVGLSFTGAYQSIVNYSIGNGVSFQGAGYVSLTDGNHGNTPDQSPSAWALFAQAGTNGAAGETGPIGPLGPAGPTGATGAMGPTGAEGPQGAQGPPVVNYRGNYSSIGNYGIADAVSYGGSTYVSLAGFNVGNTPDQSPTDWAVLVAQGSQGAAGVTGATGLQGPAGAAGTVGPTGPMGPPLTFVGEWLVSNLYAEGDAVSYGGSSYAALVGNTGREPDVSPTYWGLLAAAGAAGAVGPQGLTGEQGPTGYPGPGGSAGATGPAGPIGPAGVNWRRGYSGNAIYGVGDAVSFGGASYISVTTGNMGNEPDSSPSEWGLLAAAGTIGAAGATGSQGVVGPQGPAGAAGALGPIGPAGVNFRGPWGSGATYAAADAVTFSGSTYLATAANVAVEPDLNASLWTVLAAAGSAGPSGAGGMAATVQVGSVTTGAAGSTPAVVNVGTTSAAVLNFTIPQGAAGAAGSGGSGASTGSGLGSMVHEVSYAAVYYAANNPNQSASEDSSVLTWIPNGCTATGLQVFSKQGATITVTVRVGTLGAMADSTLSCQVATGGSCTATGSVSVPAGGFVDLRVAQADSVAAGVWTAVSCQ